MFDLGWSELMVVAVLTVLIFGPKELPTVLRTVTQMLNKARGVARDFQRTLDDVAREAELDKLKKDLQDSTRAENLLDPSGSDDGLFDNPFGEPTEKPKPTDEKSAGTTGTADSASAAEAPDAGPDAGAAVEPQTAAAEDSETEPRTAGKAG